MSHRSNRDRDAEIKARQNTAGRFGFVLGCATALVALSINLWRAPWSWDAVALAVLLACLNIPLGIALGLLAERISRDSGEKRR